MRQSRMLALCLTGLLLAWQPVLGQESPQFGGPPGFAPQGPGLGAGNPFVGAWSMQAPATNGSGMIVSTAVYNPDGTFSVTGRLPSGLLTRFWGPYRVQQVGPSQWRLDNQVSGYLPRQLCAQVIGGATSCQPAVAPRPQGSAVISFNGPNVMQAGSEVWQRDPSPALAQVQVPAQAIQTVAPPPGFNPGNSGGYSGSPGGYTPYRTPYDPGRGSQGDDLQQRRICSINGGRLEVVGGKLQCIN